MVSNSVTVVAVGDVVAVAVEGGGEGAGNQVVGSGIGRVGGDVQVVGDFVARAAARAGGVAAAKGSLVGGRIAFGCAVAVQVPLHGYELGDVSHVDEGVFVVLGGEVVFGLGLGLGDFGGGGGCGGEGACDGGVGPGAAADEVDGLDGDDIGGGVGDV